MKKALNISGNTYDISKISAVYLVATNKVNCDFITLYDVHIVIDSVDVVIYETNVANAHEIREAITNVITENTEIIKI